MSLDKLFVDIETIKQLTSPYKWIDRLTSKQLVGIIVQLHKILYSDTPIAPRSRLARDGYEHWYVIIDADKINSILKSFSRADSYFFFLNSHGVSLILLDQLQTPTDINIIALEYDENFIVECSHDDAIRYKLMF